MALDSLENLLTDQLKDIYSAEKQLLKALPKMMKRASSEALKEAFASHIEETKGQVSRLEEIGQQIEAKLTGKKCAAMEGLLEEGKEVMEEDGDDSFIDIALVAAAQRVEHYEISAYGTARTIAEHLGLESVVELLQETLDEESACDEKLTAITADDLLANLGEASEDDAEEEDEEEAAPAPKRAAGKRA